MSVSISPFSADIYIGETIQLAIKVQPNDAKDKSVSWTSSNTSVVTVSDSGLVSAIAEGTSTITASAGGKSGTCLITVSKRIIEVSSVELGMSSLEMTEGDTEALAATVKPDDATDKTVMWSSTDETIASVTEEGIVTAIKEGTATIMAMAGEKSASCEVLVHKSLIAVESIELDITTVELNPGETITLTVTLVPENASRETLLWYSSDESVATVVDGVVTAHKGGLAHIIVSSYYHITSAECEVVVPAEFECVDLGLSVLWANMNIGARYDAECGDYYAWGEIETYYSSLSPIIWKDGKESGYSPDSYRWFSVDDDYRIKVLKYFPEYQEGMWDGIPGLYNGGPDNKLVLEEEDDIAFVTLGRGWRIPTMDEWIELFENCTWELKSRYGALGYEVCSTVDGNANSIFLPGTNDIVGTPGSTIWHGNFWSSSLNSEIPTCAFSGGFTDWSKGVGYSLRYGGLSIRAVKDR